MDPAAALEQYTQNISNLPAELQHLLAELGTSDGNLHEIKRKVTQKDSVIHKFIKQHGSLTKNPKENQLYPRIREDFKKLEEIQKEKCIMANTALFLATKHLMKLETDMEKLRKEGLLSLEDTDYDLDAEFVLSRNGSRVGTAPIPNSGPLISSIGSITINSANVTPMIPAQPVPKKQTKKHHMNKASSSQASIGRPQKKQKINDSKTPEPTHDIANSTPVIRLKSPGATEVVTNIPAAVDTSSLSAGGNDEENQLYCFCQRVSFGEMVGCDNDSCKYEWFHFECVELKKQPEGKWFCPDCTELLRLKDKKKRRAG